MTKTSHWIIQLFIMILQIKCMDIDCGEDSAKMGS